MENMQALLPRNVPVDDARWANGTTAPNVGDLWIVSWNDQDLGMVLIVAVRESHVVIWPVTDESVTPSAPCFRVEAEWLHEPLVGWPEAEAGLSYAALDRNLGHVLDSRTLRGIWAAIRENTNLPDVVTCAQDDSDEADKALTRVCAFASGIGDLDFPDPDATTGSLNPRFAERHTVTARDIAALVEGPPALARQIVEGSRLLPETAALALAERYQERLEDVLAPIVGAEVIELRAPERKAKIVSIARRKAAPENDVRMEAWQQSRLAARQGARPDRKTAVAARVDRALELLDQP